MDNLPLELDLDVNQEDGSCDEDSKPFETVNMVNSHLRFTSPIPRDEIYTPTPPGSPDLFEFNEDDRK